MEFLAATTAVELTSAVFTFFETPEAYQVAKASKDLVQESITLGERTKSVTEYFEKKPDFYDYLFPNTNQSATTEENMARRTIRRTKSGKISRAPAKNAREKATVTRKSLASNRVAWSKLRRRVGRRRLAKAQQKAVTATAKQVFTTMLNGLQPTIRHIRHDDITLPANAQGRKAIYNRNVGEVSGNLYNTIRTMLNVPLTGVGNDLIAKCVIPCKFTTEFVLKNDSIYPAHVNLRLFSAKSIQKAGLAQSYEAIVNAELSKYRHPNSAVGAGDWNLQCLDITPSMTTLQNKVYHTYANRNYVILPGRHITFVLQAKTKLDMKELIDVVTVPKFTRGFMISYHGHPYQSPINENVVHESVRLTLLRKDTVQIEKPIDCAALSIDSDCTYIANLQSQNGGGSWTHMLPDSLDTRKISGVPASGQDWSGGVGSGEQTSTI